MTCISDRIFRIHKPLNMWSDRQASGGRRDGVDGGKIEGADRGESGDSGDKGKQLLQGRLQQR